MIANEKQSYEPQPPIKSAFLKSLHYTHTKHREISVEVYKLMGQRKLSRAVSQIFVVNVAVWQRFTQQSVALCSITNFRQIV